MTTPSTERTGPRPITFDDLEFRVQGSHWSRGNSTWANFVPYLKAHRVAEILDDWVGPGNWADTYEEVNWNRTAALLCRLSLRIDGDWVTKEDVGAFSNMEAVKGGCSDAFKRVASRKWGVGRKVYDLGGPVQAPCDTFTSKGKEQAKPNDRTRPALRAALEQRGVDLTGDFDVVHGDGSDAEPEDADPAAYVPTQEPAAAAPEPSRRQGRAERPAFDVDALRARVKALPEYLAKDCGAHIKALGSPDDWSPADRDAAVATVERFEATAASWDAAAPAE